MNFAAGVALGVTDNVNASATSVESDAWLRPFVTTDAAWAFSDKNRLQFNLTIGYTKYASTTDLDALFIAPGSSIAFDMDIGEVHISIFDRFSYSLDPTQRPDNAGNAVNGGNFGSANNSIGVTADWTIDRSIITGGYAYQRSIGLGANSGGLDFDSHQLFSRYTFVEDAEFSYGGEVSVSLNFRQNRANNNAAQFSVGPFFQWRVSRNLSAVVRGGYNFSAFGSNGTVNAAANEGSYYAGLTVEHIVNDFITQSLNATRSSVLGLNADLVELWNIGYTISPNVVRNLQTSANLFFNFGTEIGALTPEEFQQFGVGLNIGYPITRGIVPTLSYRFIIRGSTLPLRDYTQNTLTLSLAYSF
jgi:hypothetical protein